MRKNIFAGVALIAAVVVAGGALAGQGVITGKCVKVVDGDTLIVECDKHRRTVEIEGIDAPELEQPWGREVRGFVKDMVRGEEVEIEIVEAGEGTVRARVRVDGTDLSEMLAGRGLAWVPDGDAYAELADLSEQARKAPCGLWMDPEAQAPWEFRAANS